jgi:hypothetical protein
LPSHHCVLKCELKVKFFFLPTSILSDVTNTEPSLELPMQFLWPVPQKLTQLRQGADGPCCFPDNKICFHLHTHDYCSTVHNS